jgi:hypothetical protein
MPASTTVRLDAATKRELDRWQAQFALDGERLSRSEILARLMRVARRHEKEVLGKGGWRPFTADEREAFLRLPVKTGIRVSARDVDKLLYGGEQP